MTIRYQCPECDAVLKIKDELAGTDGKCPKCKKKFIVPEPESSEKSDSNPPAQKKAKAKSEKPEKKSADTKQKKSPKPVEKKQDDDDFDPADFLMEEGPGPKVSAGLGTPTEPEPKGPATDSQGRRLYTSSGSKARAASMSPAAAAAAAAAEGSSPTSANARDLLSQTAEESRVKASTMPIKEKAPLFDFSGAAKELARYAPHAIGAVIGIIGLYVLMDRMMGESIELPELGQVSGTVTVNGDPLSGVMVNFMPLDDIQDGSQEGPDRLRTSTGVTDDEGYYTLYYLDDIKGAAVGKGRLWLEIRSAKDLKRIPPEWSSPGPNIREVKKTGNNSDGEFNITITNKE